MASDLYGLEQYDKEFGLGALVKSIRSQNDPIINIAERISYEEGFRPGQYLDQKGKKTIGYGFNLEDPVTRKMLPKDVVDGKREMTRAEAFPILIKRTKMAENDARKYVGSSTYEKLPQNIKSALVDMAYHLGSPSLNSFDRMRTAIQSGNIERAAIELMDSKYAKEDTPNRAKRNRSLMLGGQK